MVDKENNVLFVIGQISNNHPQAGLIKAVVAWLSSQTDGKVYEMATGANAVGAEICGMSAQTNVADILNSNAKSFLIYQAENDDFANAYGAQVRLEDSDSVVVMASFADDNMKKAADVILPIGLASEVAGSYFNNFAQLQSFAPAAKLPADSKPGWRVLRVLANMLNVDGFTYDSIDEISSEVAKLAINKGEISTDIKVKEQKADDFVLFNETTIYDVDMLTRRSQPLQDTVHASTDNLNINSVDAKKLGIENAMQIIVNQQVDGDTITQSLFANIDDNVPVGSVNVHKCVGLRTDALNVTLIVGDSV